MNGTIGFGLIGGQDRAPQGAQEENFRQYRQKKITEAEYYDTAAMLVIHTINDYRPKRTTPLSDQSLAYLRERELGKRDRDPTLHKRHGDWVYVYQLTTQDNMGDATVIQWAIERMGTRIPVERARNKLDEYAHVIMPPDFFARLKKVQIMDMDEKRRGIKTEVRK